MKRKIPVVLNQEEIKALKEAPGTRYRTGKRDKAIIYLALNTGLRVDEVCNLKLENIDLNTKVITLDHAKYDSYGSIPFNSDEVVKLIKAWLKVKPKSSWLFCTITEEKIIANTGITKPGNKLSRQYLTGMVNRYGKKAGIEKSISFHTLRHTFATWLYLNKHDLEVVRKQLRHESINSTTIYVKASWQFEGHKALNGFQL